MTASEASFYVVAGPNGDLSWRVTSPAHYLGAKVTLIPDSNPQQIALPNLDGAFPWIWCGTMNGEPVRVTSKEEWHAYCSQRASALLDHVDYPNHEGRAAVFTRPLAWLASHMIEMKTQGIRVVAEVDDNYLSARRLNVFLQKSGFDQNDRANHASSVATGDAIIFSTEYLRDLYWKGLGEMFGKKHLPEFHVCRNHVDDRFWPDPIDPHPDGKLRIGYMGSDSHVWDVFLIHDALQSAHDAGHEVWMVGIDPANLNPKFTKGQRWTCPYFHVPWRNEGYRGDGLPFDIAFAPLKVDHHTLGKSDIKILEYGMSGAATVAQNCAVYNRTHTHGETALLASSKREFHDRMWELIRSHELRDRLVTNTVQYIREERLLRNNVDEWREAILG